MKFTALILLLGMFGMAIQPPMSDMKQKGCNMTSMVKSCCAGKHHTQDKQNKKSSKDCCSDGACSSIGCCSCCMFYYAPVQSFKFTSFTVSSQLDAAIHDFMLSDLAADNFHPPELV